MKSFLQKFNLLLMLFIFSFSSYGQTKVESYSENFSATINLDLWRPNKIAHADGRAAFETSQVSGVLRSVVDQVNFYDGQLLNFTANENIIIDMSGNPYVTFDVKVQPGAAYLTTVAGVVDTTKIDSVPFLVSPWGPDTAGVLKRQFLAINKKVPADGKWHTIRYDISSHKGLPDFNGTVLGNDLTKVNAILLENVVWPGRHAFSMDLDNFKIGESAAPPTVVTSYKEDFNAAVDLNLWRPNKIAHADGRAAFETSQVSGVLRSVVDQVNFYDGQFLNFTANENIIIDMSGNPYVTFDVKVQPGAAYLTTVAGVVDTTKIDSVPFLVSPWGPDTAGVLKRQFLAINKKVPADGKWHTIRYDISSHKGLPDFNGTVLGNDLTKVNAILLENVVWPGRHAFSMDLDNFKIGESAAPTAPTQNKTIPVVKNKFWAEWKVSPTHVPLNGGTGLGQGNVGTWGDMGVIVRFNPDGKIDAYNGSGYTALNEVEYKKDEIYTIEVIGDVVSKTYNVRIKEGVSEWVEIGKDFVFRSTTSQDEFNFMAMHIDENTAFGGVPEARLRASFLSDDYTLGHHNLHGSEIGLTGTHIIKCKAMPTANKINAGYSLSANNPTQPLAWGEYSTIIRFNTDGLIDVRDGVTYNADASMAYTANTIYDIEMNVDVPNKKYSVSVTPQGGSTVILAKDYDFRVAADKLDYVEKTILTGTNFGGAKGDLIITDFSYTVSTHDLKEVVAFDVHPNPASESILIKSNDNIDFVTLTTLNGVIIKSIPVKGNQVSIDLNNFVPGIVLVKVQSGANVSAKKLIIH